MRRRNKYGNKKAVVGGIKYDSKKESKNGAALKERLRKGEIRDLEFQKTIRLEVNGYLVCKYIADAVYYENDVYVIEDTKSAFTAKLPVYRIKKKLVKAIYGIDIKET